MDDEVIKKVSDMPSDKKGYIAGIRYYYDIIMRAPGLSQNRAVFRVLTDFGMELEDLTKYEEYKRMFIQIENRVPSGKMEISRMSRFTSRGPAHLPYRGKVWYNTKGCF